MNQSEVKTLQAFVKVPTDQLTQWSIVLLEKLTITQLVKKFPTFYGTQWFITMFTRTHQKSLSWARRIQSRTSYNISLVSVLVLSRCIWWPGN